MLSLNDLLKFAESEKMPQEKRRGILREYLQTLTLFYIQRTDFASKIIFIGGTALRFMHGLERFSEDLDFNYSGKLTKPELTGLITRVQNEFKAENINMDFAVRKSHETYFHWKVYMQFPDVLQFYGCGGRKGHKLSAAEKLSIQLDFQNLGQRKYPATEKIISKFGKRFLFNTADLDMFLAEKSNAVLFRKPPRGRDFFDLMSLILRGAKVNLKYLRMRDIPATNKGEYIGKIKTRVKKLNFTELTKQLAPFLFNPDDAKIMRNFPQHIDDLLGKC